MVGRVRRAFGLKGEIFVQPTTDEPDAVFAPGRRLFASGFGATIRAADHTDHAGEPRECTVERSRTFKDGWLVKFAGVEDKTAADGWRGVTLSVPFAQLTPPGENEVYQHELAGMRVRDEPHGEIGEVAGWYQLPQGLVLEVRGPAWRADVPFNEAFIAGVDRDARTIDVRLPAGMLEPVQR